MNDKSEKAVAAAQYYITEHFRYTDLMCPCCDMLKLVPALFRHMEMLERMRRELGFPVIITSGHRCARHNAEAGGAARSWHLLFATDVQPQDGDQDKLLRMFECAKEAGFGGIGRYERHIHLDLRPRKVIWRS